MDYPVRLGVVTLMLDLNRSVVSRSLSDCRSRDLQAGTSPRQPTIGIAGTSSRSFPVGRAVDYTGFAPLSASNKDLGEFQTSLAFNLLPNKLFNISANCCSGRRKGIGLRDQTWTAGLSIHY